MSEVDPVTILVVDDDDASRYVKAHVLGKRGYKVVEAARGGDALKLVESERPALVLLDVKLPDTSGIQVCRQIKASHPNTIVLQTSAAFTASKDRSVGLEGGADSYLIEPIDPDELIATVGSLLRLREAEQELRSLNEALEQRVTDRTRELVETNRRLEREIEQRTKAEEALRHAEKLDAIGQLTGGVAHDFNNLLTVVLGNLDLLDQELAGEPHPQQERRGRLVTGAKRAALDCQRLTHQLLAFARRDVLRLQVFDPAEFIGKFDALFRRALGERIEPVFSFANAGARCRVDSGQLEAALLNLAINARDAMPLGGEVRVGTRKVTIATPEELGPAWIPAGMTAKPGTYIGISVADTGTGMAPDILGRAFEPFFTTKDIGQGSGLGLSQVYGFVRQSGGFLTVATKPDGGTTITLYLQTTREAAAAPQRDAQSPSSSAGGTETILIVEDNELVSDFAVAAMSDLGYRILLARNARAALDIIAGGEPIDLLFTDVVLPQRMSGIELAREARRLRAGLKVLMTSGYSGFVKGEFAEREFPLLPKPYRHQELASRLREILTAP